MATLAHATKLRLVMLTNAVAFRFHYAYLYVQTFISYGLHTSDMIDQVVDTKKLSNQ
jgi:hypothetical protein